MTHPIETIGADRVVALIRAREIPDAARLADTLAAAGIRSIELTFTTPEVERHIADAATVAGVEIGAGTVLTAAQAESAVNAGAGFLVTPGLSPVVARVAAEAGVPVLMGAFTPSEVMQAVDLGAAAVKVFPAQTAGPAHFKHLLGPMPELHLIASGGIDAGNARAYLDAGAYAVTAGSSVVSAAALAAGEWASIDALARQFVASLKG